MAFIPAEPAFRNTSLTAYSEKKNKKTLAIISIVFLRKFTFNLVSLTNFVSQNASFFKI